MKFRFGTPAALVFASIQFVTTPGGSVANEEMDSDGDALPDSVDVCPGAAGPMEFSGCPDFDGDFMPDAFDQCSEEPGELIFDGCPDSDGDFLADSRDLCPVEHGDRNFAGCSDPDADAIAGPFDSCPGEPGPPEFAGCPDSDGDYMPDAFDTCPDEAGTFLHGGCRDSDRDFIPDQFDVCPDEPGPPEHAGCPDFQSIPPDVELGLLQTPFGFGSSTTTEPEGFRFCYGVYDTQNLELTDTVIFEDTLIRPSNQLQTFDVFLLEDPDSYEVARALEHPMPEGFGVGYGLGFLDCSSAGGAGPEIQVEAGEPIGLFRLTVPPFSIVETAPGFFEVAASSPELGVSAFRWSTTPTRWEDSDSDGFPDWFDSCPLEPGEPPFGGCPDSDHDYFPDGIDLCPDASGPDMGCPDSDGDGLPDPTDICPLHPGDMRFGGCPDTDWDGFPHPVDSCPDDPGRFSGCADTDADQFTDPVDLCIDQPGYFVGCDDSDSDGVPDNVDRCPLDRGPWELLGCSDSDLDGVPDSLDNCPIDPNPDQTDTDGDQLGNVCDADDDNDGLPDSYESLHACLSPIVHEDDTDFDDDELIDWDEYLLGTDPCDPDTDDDGLPDGVELYGLGAFGTDPLDPDSDDDAALDGSDNCPKSFHEETNRSGFNPDQSDLDGDGLGDVCDPDADGDGAPNTFDGCPLANPEGLDADSDGCRDTLGGFVTLASSLDDLPDAKLKTILNKTAGIEHQLCEVGNANGGVRKLRDLQAYLRAQSEKSISTGTSELLVRYLENLIEQVLGGGSICSLP